MYRVAKGKRRLNVIVPEKVFLQMENECSEFGVNKSSIVSTALVQYYKGSRDRSTASKDAG